MRVKKTKAAAAAERHIIGSLYAESPQAAARLMQRFDAATALLQRFPQVGRPGQRPGTRELIVSETRYLIIYRLVASSIEVLDYRHTARNG